MQMACKYNDLTIYNVNGLPNKEFLLENKFLNDHFFVAINEIYILIHVFVTFYWFMQPKTTVKDLYQTIDDYRPIAENRNT